MRKNLININREINRTEFIIDCYTLQQLKQVYQGKLENNYMTKKQTNRLTAFTFG